MQESGKYLPHNQNKKIKSINKNRPIYDRSDEIMETLK